MVDDELIHHVRVLPAEGLSAKQIARALGVAPSCVAPIVRAIAQELAVNALEPAIVGCWVSAGWSIGVDVHQGHGWPDRLSGIPPSGLLGVVVAREEDRNHRVSVCGYLVDTYCLGVKDAIGPRPVKGDGLGHFVRRFFEAFGGDPVRAPIDLAQSLVWGAVEYARGLGFEPAADFGPTTAHLGSYGGGPNVITFGCDGMPCYVEGPYDDAAAIIQTLEESAGRDNFHFIAELPIRAMSSSRRSA